MTLNFDLGLSLVNSELCHRFTTFVPNFMKIGLDKSRNHSESKQGTNELTN